MDEQNQQILPPQPKVPPQNINPVPATTNPNPPQQSYYGKRGWLKWVLIYLTIAVLIYGGIYYYLATQQKKSSPYSTNSPTPTISQPSPTPDLYTEGTRSATANWKTYTNTKVGYTISYPEYFEIDTQNEEAVSIYRKEDITNPKYDGMGRCCGMTIYFRNYGGIDVSGRPLEKTFVNEHTATRIADNPQYMEDIWVDNPNKKNTVRIGISTFAAKPPYDKDDFEIYNQILSTFKFTQ